MNLLAFHFRFYFPDGHDEIDIQYKWFQRDCNQSCNEVFIYEKNLANFEIIEAIKTKEQTIYHTRNTYLVHHTCNSF